MGSSQSAPEQAAIEQRIREQLNRVRLEDEDTERGYVSIETEKSLSATKDYSSDLTVSARDAKKWEKELLSDPKNILILSALTSNDINTIVSQKAVIHTDTQVFNVKIPFEGTPITNQRSSGRCWLFATTNVHRVPLMLRHNLSSFELSQSYLFFWDKLEKANWFLTQILDTTSHDLSSRLLQTLLAAPINDGGQWDMANNLVYKYGLVPQQLYPDSYNAMSSSRMDSIITSHLRSAALTLRKIANYSHTTAEDKKQKLLAFKARTLHEVHTILTLMLGPPPSPNEKFTWEYLDKDAKYHKTSMTPLEFAHELYTPSFTTRVLSGVNPNELFSLVNDPRHPYLTHLTVDRLGNVVDGKRPITYINVDMATMKRATIKTLKAGIPVFFGSDVGKFSDSPSGIMDTKLFDYNLALPAGDGALQMSKSERLRVGESAMTHAMVLTAVHLEKDKDGKEKSIRWRVQNSWGTGPGDQGWFLMTDEWMDEFVYQVVVAPGFVEKEVRDCLKQDPTVLPLWDPMGALA